MASIKKISKLILGLNFVWIFFSQPLFSQSTATNDKEREQPKKHEATPKKGSDSTFRLGEVEIKTNKTGRLSTKDIFTSVDVVGKSLIQNQNVNYVWELFNRIPGALLTNFNQGNVNGKFSFRGFNGEGEINAVKLLIDGIPSNTNDGNMPFLDALFPLSIESIETVRGTNDPRYGLYSIAGNANITTTLGGTYAKGRVNHGSFNTTDIQAGAGYQKSTNPRLAWCIRPLMATAFMETGAEPFR